jgi:non-haem dioxygenase in morphine synthesis N-terminal
VTGVYSSRALLIRALFEECQLKPVGQILLKHVEQNMAHSTPVAHELDVIDFTAYLNGDGPGDLPKRVLESLRNTSCLVVKDPRVTEQQNEDFLDLMESYFSLPREQKMKDARPELSYQVGVPSGVSTTCRPQLRCVPVEMSTSQ